MSGSAKTNQFVLGSATVMIGAPADLYDLNPTDHSIGLVKNFAITAEAEYLELTQGTKNQIVYSTLTSNPVRASMEVYEYTAKNLAYALGLNSAPATLTDTSAVAANVTAAATTFTVTAGHGTKFAANDYVIIKKDNTDDFVIRKVTNVSTDTITVDKALPAISSGAAVLQVNRLDGGSKDDQAFYSAKVAAKLADGSAHVILLPKIRVTRGFNLQFTTDNYSNMPFEFTVYDPVSTDPHYNDFKNASFALFQA